MDSARSDRICRHFLNGSCRLGSRCSYRHERPVSTQICRYFQKGGCWYGERCRYLHPEDDATVSGRRSSVPTVYSSASCTPVDRRGPEPALLQAELQILQTTLSISQQIIETASIEAKEDGAAAAASSTQGNAGEMSGFLQRKNVSCGICMDNVYEKKPARNSIFGILPNCNHPFCKQCITTWRKMRDYGPDVVKGCPQCRVRSAFYVPSKYWVEGQEKDRLIAAFKERCSKKSCRYYMRYGCCPFNTDCLYLHDKKCARRVSLPVNPTKISLPLHNVYVVDRMGAGVLLAYTVL
uniref:RING-type E3 ubiquitin transferase n=1 Tax=Mola mola TaxID=94237 RepID=A0A3Q3W356_MOLML